MSTDYQPGTVAVATIGGKTQRIFRTEDEWCDEAGNGREGYEVTDVRPLVVLDLAESVGKGLLADWLRNNVSKIEEGVVTPSSIGKDMRWLADQIEAQTKPPRIPEPSEPLTEVMASTNRRERRPFVRGMSAGETKGRWVDGVASYSWSELIDPALVREGVES